MTKSYSLKIGSNEEDSSQGTRDHLFFVLPTKRGVTPDHALVSTASTEIMTIGTRIVALAAERGISLVQEEEQRHLHFGNEYKGYAIAQWRYDPERSRASLADFNRFAGEVARGQIKL